MINSYIKQLVQYGIKQGILDSMDYSYSINKLCDLLMLPSFNDIEVEELNIKEPSSVLKPILDYVVSQKIIEVDTVLNRDMFEAKLMDCIIPRPSEVVTQFNELWWKDTKEATDYFYHLSKKSNYIKTSRTDKNIIWKSETPFGLLDMTVNLSKPEKDPLDIIASKNKTENSYPKCLLCKEHVGYSGRPGRSSHRIIPLELNEELFHLQYSPYVYYNEHCIVLKNEHEPMNVSDKTFKRLFDFVDQFPHYFLGSNAGLPIVGGSILSHEHYQGGSHHFAIEDAEVQSEIKVKEVTIKKIKWPLSVIRLESGNRDQIIHAAITLFDLWEQYNDESVGIISKTDEPHNAITPIARKQDDVYILDMALRNNRTSDLYPLGIFHPHSENHNIKKENIGLIEVMGLAVLPARLQTELPMIKDALLSKKDLDKDNIHYEWKKELQSKYNNQNIAEFLHNEVALKFTSCLEDAGVYKQEESSQVRFDVFINNYIKELHHQ